MTATFHEAEVWRLSVVSEEARNTINWYT